MFAELTRAYRLRLALTQEELAGVTGLSVRSIGKIEADQIAAPRPATVRLLADAFGLTGGDRDRFCEAAAGRAMNPLRSRMPAQLPSDVSAFTGRAEQLAHLDALLTRTTDQPTAVVIVVVAGTAGVGKTALVVRWAHRVRDRFPDGQLHIDLHGYAPGSPMPPLAALARFLHALGVPPERVPAEVEEAAALYRSLLADRRVLVVLDNAASPKQVRPLLPGGDGSMALVTSRDLLTGLTARDGAYQLSLDVLAPDEAHALLAGMLGADRVRAEPAAVIELGQLCGYLPLALRIAAANLAARPAHRIAERVRQLRDHDRLAALAIPGDIQSAVSAAFELSYARLADSPKRMFRLLGLVPYPDTAPATAAALAGTTAAHARQLLDLLVDAHLCEEPVPARYTSHDLLRRYAAELAGREESEADRVAARSRLYDFYLHTAEAAAQTAYPHSLRLPRAGEAAGGTEEFGDAVTALRWLDAERANLVATIQHAADHHRHDRAWGIADCLRGYFWLRMHAGEWAAAAHTGLAAAQAVGDLRAQAACHLSLANLGWRQQRFRDAAGHGTTALRLAHRTGWEEGKAAVLGSLGGTYARIGAFDKGAEHFRQALDMCRRGGWRHGEATAHSNLGSILIEMGRLSQAAEHTHRALALNAELGAHYGRANGLVNLGTIHYLSGRFGPALETLDRAQALCQEIGSSSGTCTAQRWLATTHLAAGHYDRATELVTSAIALARDKGHRIYEADLLTVRAAIHQRTGQPGSAVDCYHQAQALSEQAAHGLAGTEAQIGLATVHVDLGQRDQARGYLEQALATCRKAGLRLLRAQALTVLARLHLAEGDDEQAHRQGEQALAIHQETGHRLGEAYAHLALGHIHHHTGDGEAAARHWRHAHSLFTEIGTPEAAETATLLDARTGSRAGPFDGRRRQEYRIL